jgi:broad specificity phosphatase PhoE
MELGQGEWEGRTHAEVRERWPAELAGWQADPVHHHAPGGESLRDGMARVGSGLEMILADDTTVAHETPWSIVVAHDGILRLLILDLLGIGIDRFWSFPLSLAGVSVLDLSGPAAQLRAHNLDAHVTALGRTLERPAGAL